MGTGLRRFFGSFPSEVRPEFVNGESSDLIRDLCDNRMVVFGAQSGNPRMLEIMRGGHSVEDVRKACRVLIERCFESVVDFIVGLPGESIDEMNESAAFMEELGEMGVHLHVHTFMPLPGSPWAALAPTPIPHAVRRRMERLIAKGSLFGQWAQQEKLVSEAYFE
ncbi:MAG: radical SAM protein [Syntrophobacteraceae bacterium]